jgi:hypothetical protein
MVYWYLFIYRDDSMDCSISLTQLMDNMSYVESQSQSVQKDTDGEKSNLS